MDFIRDFVETMGLQRGHFDAMIYGVIAVGGVWAAIRLYRDLTGPPIDYEAIAKEEEN